ncbi:unnamed protein product, partial [Prorocentrum cordatum]
GQAELWRMLSFPLVSITFCARAVLSEGGAGAAGEARELSTWLLFLAMGLVTQAGQLTLTRGLALLPAASGTQVTPSPPAADLSTPELRLGARRALRRHAGRRMAPVDDVGGRGADLRLPAPGRGGGEVAEARLIRRIERWPRANPTPHSPRVLRLSRA